MNLKPVIGLLESLKAGAFTGSIKINFFRGGITNINKEECLKPEIIKIELPRDINKRLA